MGGSQGSLAREWRSSSGTASARKMAVPMDSGTAMTMAMKEEASVPAMKARIPYSAPDGTCKPFTTTGSSYKSPKFQVTSVRKCRPLKAMACAEIDHQKQNNRAERGGDQEAQAQNGEAEGAKFHGTPLTMSKTLPGARGREGGKAGLLDVVDLRLRQRLNGSAAAAGSEPDP